MSDADRLREDIDTGLTRDKVPFRDPAAAPLGTDDEAAGAAPSPERAALAAETASPAATAGGGTDERGRAYDDKGASVPGVSFVTAIVGLMGAVVAVAALAAAFMG